MKSMRWVDHFFKYKTPIYRTRLLVSSAVGAFVTLWIVGYTSQALIGNDYPLLVASMGAAIVLVYMAPGNLMAQPWPLIGGHLVSAFVGVTCLKLIPDKLFAATVAISLAIILMHYMRCLHPPGGAAALIPIVGESHFSELGYWYVVAPVGVNVLVMLLVALVVLNVLSGRRYPADYRNVGAGAENLKLYVQRDPYINEYRVQNSIRCRDVMTPINGMIRTDASIEEVTNILKKHEDEGIVTVNTSGHVLGLATAASLTLSVGVYQGASHEFSRQKLLSLSEMPLKRVATVREDHLLHDVIPLIEQQNVNEVVIVDREHRPLGWLKHQSPS